MKAYMKAAQIRLKDLGFDPGLIDGIGGKQTAAAFQEFLAKSGLYFTVLASTTTLTAVGPLDAPVAPKPPVPANNEVRLPWITEARSMFGWHEVNDRVKLSAWLRSDGKTLGDPAQLPWCGDAAETCIKNALPDEPFPGALGQNPYWALNWALFGMAVAPCFGEVGVFERDGGKGHVGFLVGQDLLNFFVLGGNQGNAFNISTLAKSRLVASRWPLTWRGDWSPLPWMDAKKVPQSTNEF